MNSSKLCFSLIASIVLSIFWSTSAIAETCTVDSEAIESEATEKYIVLDANGINVGYLVQKGVMYIAYSEKTGWYSASFESKATAIEAICDPDN